MKSLCLAGALLLAALAAPAQQPATNPKIAEILRFTLDERPDQIVKLLGPPAHIEESPSGYQSWRYEQPAEEDSDDNSEPAWFVCVQTQSRRVVSVTRTFDRPQDIDPLFPPEQTTVHYWPSKDARQYSLRLHRLSGDVLLLGMGTKKPGERTTQLMLIRRSALKAFMPWLAEQLQ